MSLYQQFGVNPVKVEQGVEIKFGKNDDGTIPTFIVARAARSNKTYKKGLEVAMRPYRRQIELETLADSTADEVLMDVFLDTILKGWQHVQDENGVPLAFNKENAKKLFTDLPDLYEQLLNDSQRVALFREDAIEADAKN
jgi:hypothetical protein